MRGVVAADCKGNPNPNPDPNPDPNLNLKATLDEELPSDDDVLERSYPRVPSCGRARVCGNTLH